LLLSDHFELYHFYLHIAIDTTSFAWKEACALLIAHEIINKHGIAPAIGVWFCILLFASMVIYIIRLISTEYLHVTPIRMKYLQTFESETFALAIAYSFTLIVAYLVYSTDTLFYFSGADDDADSGTSFMDLWVFFIYAMLVTIVTATVQTYENQVTEGMQSLSSQSQEGQRDFIEKYSKEERQEREPVPLTRECSTESSSSLVALLYSDSYHEGDSNHSGDDVITVPLSTTGPPPTATTTSHVHGTWDEAFFKLYKTVLWWDTDLRYFFSMVNLLKTTQGCLVGSAWVTWSILSLQTLFVFEGADLVSAVIFALLVTYTVLFVINNMTMRLETLSSMSAEKQHSGLMGRYTLVRIQRTQLLISSARLTVGWVWEEVVGVAINFIDYESVTVVGVEWVKAAVNCIVALLFFIVGCYVQQRLNRKDPTCAVHGNIHTSKSSDCTRNKKDSSRDSLDDSMKRGLLNDSE